MSGNITAPIKQGRGRPTALEANDKTIKLMHGFGRIFATTKEIAGVMGVQECTLFLFWEKHPEVKLAYEKGKENGKMSLRRKQLALCDKHPAMAIFLGKNNLGQRDVQRNENVDLNFKAIIANATPEQLAVLESLIAAMPDKDG